MHHQHYQLFFGYQGQIILNKLNLSITQPAVIVAAFSIFRTVPNDIVQDEKVSRPIIKRVIARPIVLLERFITQLIVRCIKIDIVIPNHVVPRDSNQSDRLIQRLHQRKVIKNNIAKRHAKSCVMALLHQNLLNHIMLNVFHFFEIPRLRITKEECFKLLRFALVTKRKINGFR